MKWFYPTPTYGIFMSGSINHGSVNRIAAGAQDPRVRRRWRAFSVYTDMHRYCRTRAEAEQYVEEGARAVDAARRLRGDV